MLTHVLWLNAGTKQPTLAFEIPDKWFVQGVPEKLSNRKLSISSFTIVYCTYIDTLIYAVFWWLWNMIPFYFLFKSTHSTEIFEIYKHMFFWDTL